MKPTENRVLRIADCDGEALSSLLGRYGLNLAWTPAGEAIPGSFWGDEEAGLLGDSIVVRPDTPVHSVLHETCHYICMDSERRSGLHTDAGGDYDEENAVCYLQILLADELPGFGRARMMSDMDAWGYSFRLGSARRWFEEDARDARDWLIHNGLISPGERPSFQLRD